MKPLPTTILAALTVSLLGSLSGCATLDKMFGTGQPAAEPAKPEPEARPVDFTPSDFAEAEPLLVEAIPSLEMKAETKLLRAAFHEDRWEMLRTNAGVLTGRRVSLSAYVADVDGVCWSHLCGLYQDESLGAWGAPYLRCNMGRDRKVTCDSVEALPQLPGTSLPE